MSLELPVTPLSNIDFARPVPLVEFAAEIVWDCVSLPDKLILKLSEESQHFSTAFCKEA